MISEESKDNFTIPVHVPSTSRSAITAGGADGRDDEESSYCSSSRRKYTIWIAFDNAVRDRKGRREQDNHLDSVELRIQVDHDELAM